MRYVANTDIETCESIVVVADTWQNKAIRSILMTVLVQAAKAIGLIEMIGLVLAANVNMLNLTNHLGLVTSNSEDYAVKLLLK